MLKNWKKKLTAILLIFTMTFSNFALVGKTYAAYMVEGIFGSKQQDAGDTGSSNVEFDVYFKTSKDSKKSKTVSSDIKNTDLIIGATVKVKDSGYLKDAKILFGNGKELNFKVNSEVLVPIQTEESKVENVKEVLNEQQEVQKQEILEEQKAEQQEMVVEEPNEVGKQEIVEKPNEVMQQEIVEKPNEVDGQEVVEEVNQVVQEEILEKTEETFETKYETKNLVEENDKVQSFENNELYLVQLNANSEMEIEFPISYEYKKFVEEEMISKTNQIKFKGIYMKDNATEVAVEKTVDLKLSWEDEREIETSSEITKYIGYNQDGANGIILQNSVTVDSKTDEASLPIKDSKVEITVPVIDGVKPDTVNVVAKSLVGTSGKDNDEVIFGENNWNYDIENNKITITVANNSELVSTQNENDILIDETAPMKDMYFSESGIDNYLITYTYKNVAVGEREIQTTVDATLNEFGKTKLNDSNEVKFELKDEVGNIVTYSNETNTTSVSKGYTYLNYNNEDNKYEIQIDNKLIFNVSYKDIVEGLYYVDNGSNYVAKTGESYGQEDLYYKTLTINKDNFNNMLGEEGKIEIYNNQELIFTVDKETQASEDGVIEVKFENTVKNIQIQTSKPINDGNLIIGTLRAYSNVEYEKDLYKNFDKLTINTVGKAKYKYVDNLVYSGNSNLDIKLEDTKTNATLEIGQESLSTLAMNNNVELKIKLNNEKIESDTYGNSRFQIKLPEYVETVEVTDYNIVYGEGLELDKVQGFVEDGRAYIDITVNGKQNKQSAGLVSEGTNIVLLANIKVDLFAPATEANFELTYINEDATNYNVENQDAGYSVATVKYSAPSGVVSVNSISGYSSEATKTITSVHQGEVKDEIAVYSDSKVAKAELTIMNNEKNDIEDVMILGRVPFEGVKDITTGEELGTTINTKMVTRLIPEDMNETEFKFYYSENGEATNDLNDSENGWTDELNTLDNVKSFLIVPAKTDYKMEKATKLRFTYEFEIPANLEHNEEIYGTFATFYTNNTEIATIKDVSRADLVGLITGEGPKFDFVTTTNKTSVNEYEELEIITTVKNTGKMTANNIVVTVPMPEYTDYVSAISDNAKVNISNNNGRVEFKLDSLEVDETVTFKTVVEVNPVLTDDNGDVQIKVYSLITATDLDALLKTQEQVVTVKHAEMQVSIENTDLNDIMYKGNETKLYIRVQNLNKNTIHNAVATMKIEKGFDYEKATVIGLAENGVQVIDVRDAEYDEATRTVTWKIGDIRSLEIISLRLYLKIGDLDAGITQADIQLEAKAKADGTEEYTSGKITFKVGKPILVITQTTSTTNSYVKEGDVIDYQFNVKNEGSVPAEKVTLTDHIPDGLVVKSVSYVSQGVAVKKAVSAKDEVTVGVNIPAGDTLTVNVSAMATSLNGQGERSVTNNATISAENMKDSTSNDITHIVEGSGNVVSQEGEHSVGKASSTNTETKAIVKTYKITGTAWLDKDNDGMRQESEQLLKGVTATLVNSDGGVIKQTTVTNSKGEYTFAGVPNGNYIIIFDYDTVRYSVTVYQKENVAQNVNSDVITTKIEQDGKYRNGAVTGVVTITDGSVSNIDIGLIDALKFDLNLDMGISKITTNTAKGTETKNYENSKLTKTEIAAKQVAGSSVYIEYTLSVKNEGELAGYAKKIVDYVPEGMEFNSGMNQEWWTGTDGNLYTTSLSDVEIQPGETKTFKLVLSKELTDDNIGTVSNTAEIVEDYNIYGISDMDSIPSNKAQNEDDFARADSYLSVKTGEVFIYISVIITTIILTGIVVAIVVIKFKNKMLAKGGVN